jgi:hypothetical protein
MGERLSSGWSKKIGATAAAVRAYTPLDADSANFNECCSALTKRALDPTVSPVQAYAISCTLGHRPFEPRWQ